MEPVGPFRKLLMYRHAIGAAVLVGIALAFIWANRQTVEVHFPLLGDLRSPVWVVMLVCGGMGAGLTWLLMKWRSWRSRSGP